MTDSFRTTGLQLQLGNKRILDGIDFALPSGQLTALLGCNGAGKSSLLKVLAGDLAPSGGEVHLHDKPLSRYSAAALARHRAVLTQKPTLSFAFRVRQVVEMGTANRRLRAAQRERCVDQMLQLAGVEHLAERDYTSCSGGEQQRVQFARVLAQLWGHSGERPPVLLLDEPVSALDLAWQQRVLEIARWLIDRHGWSVLAVLHDMNQAAAYADQVVLLEGGRCLAQGSPGDTLTDAYLNQAFAVIAHVQAHPLEPARPHVLPIRADLPAIDNLLAT